MSHDTAPGRLREEVLALDWASVDARVREVGRIDVRTDSIVVDIALEQAGQAVEAFVKQHRHVSRDGRPPERLAVDEFDALTRLHALLREPFGVPRPLLLDERRCVVAMERAAGSPLDTLIRRARRHVASRTVHEPLRRAGAWLRELQARTSRTDGAREAFERYVEDVMRGAADDATRQRIATLARRVAETPLTLVGMHGDLWPGNVFVGDVRTEVIDFEGFRSGFALQDVDYFLSYIERLPLGFMDGRGLRRAFLEGYCDGAAVDANALSLFRVMRGIAVPWAIGRSPNATTAEHLHSAARGGR